VEDMIEKVSAIEERYDAFSPESQEKLSKIRSAIKDKIAPALQTMLKDVLKYLKIRDKVVGNKAKNNKEAKSRISDLQARLEALLQSLGEN
ncbi:MAG: hypothetical protein MK212_21170, partial [Saprospiraceae bacterium]|nr:hypothetical protein [Saprospiraceae bacterium]